MTISRPSSNDIEVPDWARKALRAAQTAGAQQHTADDVERLRGHPAWPLLLEAAVVSTFLPRDLAPEKPRRSHRNEAEAQLLEYAEATYTIDGPAWELRRQARVDVLRLAWETRELAAALDRTKVRFGDAVSAALHGILQRQEVKPDEMDLPSLEALRSASTALSGFERLRPILPIAELDRLIRKRRLIAQFERICGGDFRQEVVGREEELETLNAYVGVIDANTVRHRFARVATSVRRAFTGRKPLAIWGTGGVGKTTLLSRFMLEHIDSAEQRYPFAYLDFDRPSLSPRDHFGLFAEICEQFIAQFEGLERDLGELRDEALRRQPGSLTQGMPIEFPPKMITQFCSIIDFFLNGAESRFEQDRPVLIVLDTFEIVQYDPSQVQHLERFVSAFQAREWARLRLIVAGRKHVKQLGEATEELELPGLTVLGADALIRRLADKASMSISTRTSRRLAEALAVTGRTWPFAQSRVHPLRIRMLGQIFAGNPNADGEKLAASLIAELRKGAPVESMIEGILVRRIVGHVRDARVRALADPGLVVRRITPEVIRLVMAHCTPRPVSGQADPGDVIDFLPWEMSHEEAKEIWTAFSREVSLVEREGHVLWHRQDVRIEMLPLIRAKTPQRFAHLHRVAFDYFRGRVDRGDSLAAEAIYHGLWSGAPLEEVDLIWGSRRSLDARIDPDEFKSDSLPALYLRSRNDEKLSVIEVRRLPIGVAGAWAGRFGERFLHGENPARDFELILAATGPQLDGNPSNGELAAIAARLLYRAGAWQDCIDLIWTVAYRWLETRASGNENTLASIIRLAVHISAKSGQVPPNFDQISQSAEFFDPIAAVEVYANLILAAKQSSSEAALEMAHARLRRAIRGVPVESWSRTRLRLAILALDRPDARLIAHWVNLTEDISWIGEENHHRDEVLQSALNTVLGVRQTRSIRDSQSLWAQRREVLGSEIHGNLDLAIAMRYVIVFDHTDWLVPYVNAIDRSSKIPSVASILKKAGMAGSTDVQLAQVGAIGQLLALAGRFSLVDAMEHPSFLPRQRNWASGGILYPNTLRELSQALLAWHHSLRRRVM